MRWPSRVSHSRPVPRSVAHSVNCATRRPVTWQDVFATLYKTLGIDGANEVLKDPTGRPQFALDTGKPIAELI